MEYDIKRASLRDVDFLVEAIMEADKSGSKISSFTRLFDMTENEAAKCIKGVLEEEIDGCELSISSFLVAYHEGVPVATVAGWKEGSNNNEPSQVIKGNLLGSHLGIKSLMALRRNSVVLKDLQVEREIGSYQLEYVYVRSDYRGKGLVQLLFSEHERLAKDCKNLYILLCANNTPAISSYRRFGFRDYKIFKSNHPDTLQYLPDNTKVLMIKNI